MVLFIFQSHEIFLLVGILVYIHTDEVAVPVLHDATDATIVDFQSLLIRAVVVGDEHVEFVRHIHLEHSGDENRQGSCVVFQVFA